MLRVHFGMCFHLCRCFSLCHGCFAKESHFPGLCPLELYSLESCTSSWLRRWPSLAWIYKGGALNVPLILGALFSASSVLLGAYGAHGLSDVFIEFPKMKTAFHNAVDYQMLHSLLLIVLGFTYYIPNLRLPRFTWVVLSISILFFSFSIYLWVFGGPKWLIKLTPDRKSVV